MVAGLHAGASAMQALVTTQDNIANNLANVSTPGFRAQRGVCHGRYMAVDKSLSGRSCRGGGVGMTATTRDTSAGGIQPTGGSLDAAIDGPGFFVVEGPENQPMYTRNGRCHLNSNSELVTQAGWRLLDVDGSPIQVTGTNCSIRDDGTIYADGVEVAQLGLVEFENPVALQSVGASLYMAPPPAGAPTPATQSRLKAKAVEMSNVSAVREMVRMMMGLRQYEAAHRAVRIIDESINLAVNKVPAL
jgi:flagellar basal body rod protein FlgG